MKGPEDKLERLYQEKLADQELPVRGGVWQRIRRRIGRDPRTHLFWWSLSALLLLLLGVGTWSLFGEGEAPGKDGAASSFERSEGSGEWPSYDRAKEATASMEEGGQDEKKSSGASEGSKKKEIADKNSDEPALQGTETGSRSKGPGSSDRQTRSSKEDANASVGRSPDAEEKTVGEASSTARESKSEVRAGEGENVNEKVSEAQSEVGSEKMKGGEPRNREKEAEGTPAISEEGNKTAEAREDPDPSEEKVGTQDEKGETQEGSGPKGPKEEEEPLIPPMAMVELGPSTPGPDSLPPMGRSLERIEFSKGSQAVEQFYVRAIGSYGKRYRSLASENGSELAAFRNSNEDPVMAFSYGLESGILWENGFGVGLGVERNAYGNSFSFEDSRTLYDTSYSTESGYNYTYEDSIIFDDSTGQIPVDTVQVVEDSTYWEDTDTSVTSHDSSYSHQHKTRYRYVTVPLMLSYELELGERWSIVPGIGVGLNFLTRSRTGWVDPDSHQERRMRYPEEDPPLKRFALSLRGRMELRYRFAERWRIGAGFRYTRFVHSVYTDAVDIDERPYGYGGSFSIAYLLKSGVR